MSQPIAVLFFPFASFFQKHSERDERLEATSIKDEATESSRIRCPLCQWQPSARSRWCCNDVGYPENFLAGCGASWNTFETRGLCPGCGHQWRWTACLSCGGWSRHEDWYTNEPE